MEMAILHAFPLHVLRGEALQVESAQEIPPPGYCSPEQHFYRCNGIRELPCLALEVGKHVMKEELHIERQKVHDSCPIAGPMLQEKKKVEVTGSSHQEMHLSDEFSSFTEQCLKNRFEAEDIHCHSIETSKDRGLHDNESIESSSPPCIGVDEGDATHSLWECPSVQKALQHMNMHRAENYVEKCVYVLQKCKRRGTLAIAARMYGHMCGNGLEANGILGSYVVAIFLHCGSLPMAQQAYNRLFHHNEYSWTNLLKGYIEAGDPERGLYLFSSMKEAGIQPSKFTYVAVLRACTRLRCVNRGKQLHTEIIEVLEEDLYVIRALVDFYIKCDLFAEAYDTFSDLWGTANFLKKTSIIGYLDHELQKDSVDFSDDMQLKEVVSSAVAYVFSLKACSSVKDLPMGRELHLQAVKEGHDLDIFVSNTLVDTYAKCGSFSEAWKVLNRIPDRDVVSWTALIAGCVEYGQSEDALKYFEMMQKEGVPANAFTLGSCLKACALMKALDSGRNLHAEIIKKGLSSEFVICNSLVDMYAKCGSLVEARMVFDNLARQDVISWTSLIAGYTDHGSFKEAIGCFEGMQMAGVSPNTGTFICCLKSCAFSADLDMGRRLHGDLVKEELDTNILVGNSLLRMYARCGSYSEAHAIFEDLASRDGVSWTILIAELAEDGHCEQAMRILEQMHKEGTSPSSFTYAHSLKACASLGALEEGLKLHNEIIKRGLEGIPLVSKALINLYAKCGKPINSDVSEVS